MKRIFSILLTISMVLSLCTLPSMAASDEVSKDLDALTLDDILSVPEWDSNADVNTLIDNLEIDHILKGEVNESPISWVSSNPAVISNAGIVTRGAADETVTLTATVGEGEEASAKEFTFLVPAASKNINGMPSVVGTPDWDDPFDGGAVISSSDYSAGYRTNFDTSPKSTAEEKDGKLVLTLNEWAELFVRRYHTQLTGKVAYEFTLGGTSDFFKIKIASNGFSSIPLEMTCYRRSNKVNLNGTDYAIHTDAQDKNWKFTVYFDLDTDTMSIWLNNKLFVENIPCVAASNLEIFNIAPLCTGNNEGYGTVIIDNLKVYSAASSAIFEAGKNVEAKINEWPAYVDANGTKFITNNLNLEYAKDSNNVTYSFTSSNTDVVSAKGVITRGVIDTPVTITAVMTDANGESITKEFNYIVPGKYNTIGKTNLPKEGEVVKSEPFGSNYAPEMKGTNASTAPYTVNNGTFSTSVAVQERSVLFFSDSVQSSGKVAYELIFDFSKYTDNKFFGAMNFDLVLDKFTKVCSIAFSLNGDAATPVIKYNGRSFSGLLKITLVADRAGKTVDFYMNDELITAGIAAADSNINGARMYFMNSNGNKGIFNYHSFRTYKIDETIYPATMKGVESFSNGGTVKVGDNSVTVPVIATTDEGADKNAMLIYAIYDGNRLMGIDIKDITLDKFAHNAFTATVNIKEALANPVQKALIWDKVSINPLTFDAIPAE